MGDDSDDPEFSTPVRSTRHTPRPHVVRTVRAALEFVNDDLHEAERARPHWQWARAVLYEALGQPPNLGKVAAAEDAFRAAMEKDRWLIGS
jgi:hypothetical protein